MFPLPRLFASIMERELFSGAGQAPDRRQRCQVQAEEIFSGNLPRAPLRGLKMTGARRSIPELPADLR